MPVAAVAAQFEVSLAWVYRFLWRRRATGSISPQKQTDISQLLADDRGRGTVGRF
jgi:hypothetical protein